MVDQLVQHPEVVVLKGESYRLGGHRVLSGEGGSLKVLRFQPAILGSDFDRR